MADYASTLGHLVPKATVATTGDYALSGDRYLVSASRKHEFPVVSIGDPSLFRVESGGTPKSDVEDYWNGGVTWATLVDLPASNFITQISSTQRTISERGLRESSAKLIPKDSVVVSTRATIGRIGINRVPLATNQGFKTVVIEDPSRAITDYVALALTRLVPTMQAWATGGTFPEISKSKFCELGIPLPPMGVQREIVAEVEGYQRVIDGARAVVDNYKPQIAVRPDWPVVEIGEIATPQYGLTDVASDLGDARFVRITDIGADGRLRTEGAKFVLLTGKAREALLAQGDILVARTGATFGKTMLFDEAYPAVFASYLIRLRFPEDRLLPQFYWAFAQSEGYWRQAQSLVTGGGQPQFNGGAIKEIRIPLPPLPEQRAIAAEIDAEYALVRATMQLITRFEQKIRATLDRVWGEETAVGSPAPADVHEEAIV